MRTERYTFLAALGLHAALILVARAMPPLSLVKASDQRDLRVIDIELPPSPPVELHEPPPALPEAPGATREPAPEARAAVRTAPSERVSPQAPSTAEPSAENPPPTAPPTPTGPDYDKLPEENGGVLGVPGVAGLGNPVWAIPGVLPQGTTAAAPAPTVAPAPREVDSDIAGKVVREAMAKNDKNIGLDLPFAGSMASAVRGAVMGSDIPTGTRGSIVCNVSPTGAVSGCRLATSTGGGATAWNAAMQAAASIAGSVLPEQYARGAVVTIDISVADTPPAGGKGGFTGTGAAFDLSNIGAHNTRNVRVSHRVAAR